MPKSVSEILELINIVNIQFNSRRRGSQYTEKLLANFKYNKGQYTMNESKQASITEDAWRKLTEVLDKQANMLIANAHNLASLTTRVNSLARVVTSLKADNDKLVERLKLYEHVEEIANSIDRQDILMRVGRIEDDLR